jgi:multiple sugar transport system permease protein
MVNSEKLTQRGFKLRPMNRMRASEAITGWLFILPSLVGFLAFIAVPALRAFWFSMTDWDLLTTAKFTGAENYQKLIVDPLFWNGLKVTLQYVVVNIPIQTVMAISLAVLMDRLTRSVFVRSVLILPYLTPGLVVALIWVWLLDPSMGIANVILIKLGLPKQAFMGSPDAAIYWIAFINIWRYTGQTAILILAGLQTIPKEVYEAAAIDGATEWRSFWHITLPLLRPVLAFVLVMTTIGSFQIYDTIAATTRGGPGQATRVILWYIIDMAFNRLNMGYASALSVALFLILVGVTFVIMRALRANTSDIG